MASVYDIQKKVVAPVDELLDHLVALNAYAVQARQAGWKIEFTSIGHTVEVTVSRSLSWPTLEEEDAG